MTDRTDMHIDDVAPKRTHDFGDLTRAALSLVESSRVDSDPGAGLTGGWPTGWLGARPTRGGGVFAGAEASAISGCTGCATTGTGPTSGAGDSKH